MRDAKRDARSDIIERTRDKVIIRPKDLIERLPYTEQTIQNWLGKLADEDLLIKFNPQKVQDTYYFLKEKRKEAEEELAKKGFDEIDIIKDAQKFKDLEQEVEQKIETIKKIKKNSSRLDKSDVLSINQTLQGLKENVESESDLGGYLAVFENEGFMRYLEENIEDINNLLEVDYHTYYHLNLFLSVWEKIAQHSADKTESLVENKSDDIWDVITLASKMLIPRKLERIEMKMMERQKRKPDFEDVKNSENLYDIRDKAKRIIEDLFEGYFQNRTLNEEWIDDLIHWYLRDDSEDVSEKIADTIVDGMSSLVNGEKLKWEKILIDYISYKENRRDVKTKIKQKLDDDRLGPEERTALSYIIKTAPYSSL